MNGRARRKMALDAVGPADLNIFSGGNDIGSEGWMVQFSLGATNEARTRGLAQVRLAQV